MILWLHARGKKDRASERIDTWMKNMLLKDIEIREFVRETDLTNLPGSVAYRLDGAHLYADILNLSDMLHVTLSDHPKPANGYHLKTGQRE